MMKGHRVAVEMLEYGIRRGLRPQTGIPMRLPGAAVW